MASFQEMTFSELLSDAEVFIDGDWVESKDQDPNGDVRLIQLADIGDGFYIDKSSRFLNKETAKRLKCTYLKEGDILVARMPDPLGRACIFPKSEMPSVTVVDVCIIRPNQKKVDNRWLMHTINSPVMRQRISEYVTGTTRQRISRGNFSKLKISVPPLAEQRRIASILDQADELRQKRQQAIEKLDQLLQATFIDIFGDPVSNPKGWDKLTIEKMLNKDKYSLKRGPFGGALKKEIFVESGYLVYEQYHALNNDFTFQRYFIDEAKYKELKAFDVKPKDIIVSCSGVNLGKLAEVPEGAPAGIINQALLKISLNQGMILNDVFIDIFMHPSFKKAFYGDFRGAAIPNFPPMSVFKEFEFIVPPLETQKKYQKVKSQVKALQKKHQLAEEMNLFTSLQNQAFSGNL